MLVFDDFLFCCVAEDYSGLGSVTKSSKRRPPLFYFLFINPLPTPPSSEFLRPCEGLEHSGVEVGSVIIPLIPIYIITVSRAKFTACVPAQMRP